jgi:hypothetical protein
MGGCELDSLGLEYSLSTAGQWTITWCLLVSVVLMFSMVLEICINTVQSIVKYCAEHKLFIYSISVQRDSRSKCGTKFYRKCPDSTVSCKALIYNVTKLCFMGLVLHKYYPWKKNILTEGTYDHISTSFETGMKLLHILALQSGLEKSEHTGIKLLGYKTIIIHSLLPPNCKQESWHHRRFKEFVFNRITRFHFKPWQGVINFKWLCKQPN